MEDLYKIVSDEFVYAKLWQAFVDIKFLFWAVLYNGRGSTAYLDHTQAQSRTTFLIQLLMMSLLVNSGMTYSVRTSDFYLEIGQKVQVQSVNRVQKLYMESLPYKTGKSSASLRKV